MQLLAIEESGAARKVRCSGLLCFPSDSACDPADHVKKKNCKSNPWCLFGLGEYCEGIWKAEDFRCLGADLLQCDRRIDGVGGGLRNLGATCYINVILQGLFSNLALRDWVFSLVPAPSEPADVASEVVRALQSTLAHLSEGVHKVVHARNFVKAMGISYDVQQDPQEFQKLLLSQLEKLPCAPEGVQGMKELITGSERHTTSCQLCGTALSSEHAFQEICLSVGAADSSLEAALQAYFADELMSGENGYNCPSCRQRTDAVRSTHTLTAPPLLTVQLLRYSFDRDSGRKGKISSAVSFAEALRFADCDYQLVSAVYHLGGSAHGGHYVCDVLDWVSGRWSHCDDESLSALPGDWMNTVPVYEGTAAGAVDVDLTGSDDDRAPKRKRKGSSPHSETAIAAEGSDSSKLRGMGKQNTIYMLCYAQRSLVRNCVSAQRVVAPAHAQQLVQSASAEFEEELNEYIVKRAAYSDALRQRQRVYERIKERFAPTTNSDNFHLLPATWLRKWITGDISTFPQFASPSSSGNVGNLSALCEHGGLRVNCIPDYKLVSQAAHSAIFNDESMRDCLDIDITNASFRCHVCYDSVVDGRRAMQQEAANVDAILRAIDTDIACELTKGMWLSKAWLQMLRRYSTRIQKQCSDAPPPAKKQKMEDFLIDLSATDHRGDDLEAHKIDAFKASPVPNLALLCASHEQPVLTVDKRAVVISASTWQQLDHAFPGGTALAVGCSLCAACADGVNASAAEANVRKSVRAVQMEDKLLAALSKRKRQWTVLLEAAPPAVFQLVDARWMAKWRQFMRDSQSVPPLLTNEGMRCPHRLVQLPPTWLVTLQLDGSDWIECPGQWDDDKEEVEVISEDEWERLVMHYYHYRTSAPSSGGGGNIDESLQTDHTVSALFSVRLSRDTAQCNWQCEPRACAACSAAACSRREESLQYFKNSDLTVLFVRDDAQLDEALGKAQSDGGPGISGTRKTRTRGYRAPKKVVVNASFSDSIGLLKLKLFEQLNSMDLSPQNQRLLKEDGEVLLNASKTLLECGIRMDSKLLLMAVEGGEGESWVDAWQDCSAERKPETGFAGTFFQGATSDTRGRQGHPDEASHVDLVDVPLQAVGATAVTDDDFEEQMRKAIEASKSEI